MSWLLGCGAPGEPPGATSLYDTSPERRDFFALPWPSDTRLLRGADGQRRLDLSGFFDPGGLIGQFRAVIAADPLDGFGTQSAIYFRFDAPLDPASLPADAAASLDPRASVFLADTSGQRVPVRVRFTERGNEYIGPHALSLLPEPGFPLRPRTTYIAVVTDAVRAADGGRVRRDPRYTFSPPPGSAGGAGLGIDPARIVVSTTFTTQDPTSFMQALRTAVYRTPAPTVLDLAYKRADSRGRWDEYTGTYVTPNFQEGEPPYIFTGGRIHLGADGQPEPVRSETVRFALTVPRAPMPAGGWPVVLYAHATAGDYESFIYDGSASAAAAVTDRTGRIVSRMAVISIDQVLHGPRDPTGSDPELSFFNFRNLPAARDNAKQGALDDFQLLRLVEGVDIAAAPSPDGSPGGPIRFDTGRIYFKGHSQGGLTGPLFLAYEPKVKAAVLSGAGGGLLLSLLAKTEPYDIATLVGILLNGDAREDHPVLTLVQTYLESSDPSNYGRLFFREPPAGLSPKSIYQSLGLIDRYTPVSTIKALALAMGVQPVRPLPEPIPTLPLSGLSVADAPVQSNVAQGGATAVLGQYQVPTTAGVQQYDGHFVVFRHPEAVLQSNAFFGLHAATGVAVLIQ
jgi:hypothetical protein